MNWKICVVLTICTSVSGVPLAAQESRAWSERAFVTIDLPFQALDNSFSETLTFADSVRRTENVNFLMQYPSTRGALIDVGAGVRLTTNLGVGVASSWSQRSNAGRFELALPNPLVANSALELTSSIPDLGRRELGVHVQALYAWPLARNVRVIFSGGPSIFITSQDVVRGVEVDILPGFRALSFDQALITEEEETSFGFNAGADITWVLARRVGVGAVTRYSRANVTWKPVSESVVSRAIKTYAGGLHIGGGVRLLF